MKNRIVLITLDVLLIVISFCYVGRLSCNNSSLIQIIERGYFLDNEAVVSAVSIALSLMFFAIADILSCFLVSPVEKLIEIILSRKNRSCGLSDK